MLITRSLRELLSVSQPQVVSSFKVLKPNKFFSKKKPKSNQILFFLLPQILYHVHKHLIDGLYPLAEELAKVIGSSSSPILSPIDRIDAFDALNAIFNSAALNVHFDTQEPEQRRRELSFVKVSRLLCDAV